MFKGQRLHGSGPRSVEKLERHTRTKKEKARLKTLKPHIPRGGNVSTVLGAPLVVLFLTVVSSRLIKSIKTRTMIKPKS